jgi:putative acetyltransferase
MRIRNELPADQAAVHALNCLAFETPAEAGLVDTLREKAAPVVSLVAEIENNIVGHILFSPVTLGENTDLKIMGLAPMAVLPDYQRQGIGSQLVTAGLEKCRELGVAAAVVLGHPNFYPKFKFVPSAQFNIISEYEVPVEVCMVVELVPGSLAENSGTVKYHAVFGEL